MWGPPTFSLKLITPEGTVPITTSLADALKHLRHLVKCRNPWADAAFINQQDLSEKGQQVKAMGRVYKNAEGVLIWLGVDAAKQAENAFADVKPLQEI